MLLVAGLPVALALSQHRTAVHAAGTGWTSYHLDGTRSGYDSSEPAWTATAPLSSWTSPALDGAIYAEPLALNGRLYVATENNSVYALDEFSGNVVWRTNLGPNATGGWGCGNISPQGITGTPVIDPASGILYAVSTSPDLHYQFNAVNLVDGSLAAAPRDITPPAMDVPSQGERSALTLVNGQVIVPFGGRYGDCGPYHPFVDAVPVNGGPVKIFQPQSSTQREAGLWAASGGASDGTYTYVATGNGAESNCSGTWDFGNGVLKLDANATMVDFWAPADWCSLSASDTDIGSVGPALLQGGLLFQSGKNGTGYLISSGRMGNFGGELFSAQVCGGEVLGGTAYSAPYLYVPCGGGGVTGIQVSGNSFNVLWHAGSFSPGPPIVAGGLMWAMSTGGGSLYGFDAVTGAQRVHVSLSGGSSNHFPTPTADSGWIFTPQSQVVHGFRFSGSAPTPTPTATPSPTYSPAPGAPYAAVTPYRLLDTRNSSRLGPQQSLSVQVTGVDSVPATATAAVINVTVTGPTAPSYLTVWPAGTQRPTASNLNFAPAQTVPNLVEVPLGASGAVSVFNWSGTTDVVMDLEGYVDASAAGRYTPQQPARVLDTRQTHQTLGSGGTLQLVVPGTAAVMNVTVTDTTASGYLTVYPSGGARPVASNLNWAAGQTVSNRVAVPSGGGTVTIYNFFGNADVVVDLNGSFGPAGSIFNGVAPARILDTRSSLGLPGPLGQGQTGSLQVAGAGGVPASATAVVINLTAVGPSAPGFVTAWPAGQPRPTASDLNFAAGATVPNLVVVQLGSGGQVSLYNLAGTTDLVGDVFGYYS